MSDPRNSRRRGGGFIYDIHRNPGEVFGTDLIDEYRKLCRVTKSYELTDFEFNATVLGMLTRPRFFKKQIGKKICQRVVSSPLDKEGNVQSQVNVAVMIETGHPDLDLPSLRNFAMGGYTIDPKNRTFSWSDGSLAILDALTHEWAEKAGDFGPFAMEDGQEVRVFSWQPESFHKATGLWSRSDVTSLQSLTGVLGDLDPSDAQILLEAPRFTVQ